MMLGNMDPQRGSEIKDRYLPISAFFKEQKAPHENGPHSEVISQQASLSFRLSGTKT